MSFARSGGAGGQNVNKGVVSFHFVLRNTPGNYSDFFNKLSTEVCIQVATSGKNSMSTLQSINSTATVYCQALHRKDESGKRNCKAYRSYSRGLGFVGAVNTKVDMRFKVMEADWLPERIRLKLLQMVCCVLS
jgi:hypothetical protein